MIIAGMAGAASFTHVHDWTMRNAPPGTGSWFGWANAIISELTPTAAGIEIRRRKRQHRPVTYPMAILIAAAALSLAAQVSQARHTLAGWLASAVPALAFLALTKLVLSRTAPAKEEPECAQPASRSHAPSQPEDQTRSAVHLYLPSVPRPDLHRNPAYPCPLYLSYCTGSDSYPVNGSGGLRPVPTAQLLVSARMAAFSHQQATGNPDHRNRDSPPGSDVPPALAESLLDHLERHPAARHGRQRHRHEREPPVTLTSIPMLALAPGQAPGTGASSGLSRPPAA